MLLLQKLLLVTYSLDSPFITWKVVAIEKNNSNQSRQTFQTAPAGLNGY